VNGDRALVRNTADPQQVRFAARKERDQAALERAAVKAVFQTLEGRFVFWGLLERAGVYKSVWHPSAAIHYNAGRQDFGHELMALLLEVDEEAYQLMEREARARLRARNREIDATHTPRAHEQERSHA
jgi:hypothetical protein